MQLPKCLRRDPANFKGPVQLHQEPYLGRGVSHQSYQPYARDNSPAPDPVLTQADFDDAAKHIIDAGEHQLAFAMQVNDYCKEMANEMRVKGAAVATEMRRSLAMSQKVAQGAQAMTKFLYDEGPQEPTEAPTTGDGTIPPAERSSELPSSSGLKGAPEGASRGEEPLLAHGEQA